MEPTHHDAMLRGMKVHYAEAGDGPPLLLIHGFLVSHKEWLPILPSLAASHRCIAVDLPGFGASDKRPPGQYPYTREAYAATLAELLSSLGIDRAHVCGHSMGGGIAMTLAADHPSLVERLVLIDPASHPFPMPFKGRLPMLPVFGPILFKRLYGRSLFRDYFRNDVFSGHPGLDLARVDEYFEDFRGKESREAAYECLQRAVAPLETLVERIPRVTAPTLLLWGEEDRIFPVSLAHRLVRELPSCQLVILEGCGHAANEEQPERTAELIRGHLSKTGGP